MAVAIVLGRQLFHYARIFSSFFHVIFGAADLNLDIVAGMKFGDWRESF